PGARLRAWRKWLPRGRARRRAAARLWLARHALDRAQRASEDARSAPPSAKARLSQLRDAQLALARGGENVSLVTGRSTRLSVLARRAAPGCDARGSARSTRTQAPRRQARSGDRGVDNAGAREEREGCPSLRC